MTTENHSPSHLTVLQLSPLAAGSWIVLLVWLVGSAAAFWYFELSEWRPFASSNSHSFSSADAALAEQWFRSNVSAINPAGAPVRITFVHLYNPACRCNRFTEPHLQRLIARYQPRGVRFLAAQSPDYGPRSPAPFDIPMIRSTDGSLATAGIRMSPAVLLFDSDGRLQYYGPYSDSAWCGSAGALVDKALDGTLSGKKMTIDMPVSRGCFCE